MKKKMIKQIIVAAVCAVLIISAFLLSRNFNEVIAGAGKGKNAKIETIDSLSAVVSGINGRLGGYGAAEGDAASEYRSFTLCVTSGAKVKQSVGGDKMYLSLSREMTLYATENASYYVTDGVIESEQTTSDNENTKDYNEYVEAKNFLSFKICIYIEKDYVMVRFDKWDTVFTVLAAEEDNEADYGLADSNIYKVLGKWLKISREENSEYGEIVSLLNSINSSNFDVIGVMGNYLNDESKFNKDGKKYSLLKEYSKQFIDDIMYAQFGFSGYSDDTDKASFDVDLSNRTEPQLTLSLKSEYSKTNNEGKTTVKSSASSVDIFDFKNINNTVIKAPSAKNALSFEEFKDMVEG